MSNKMLLSRAAATRTHAGCVISPEFGRDISCNGPFGTKAHNILTALFHFHQNPKTMPSASVAAVTHSLG